MQNAKCKIDEAFRLRESQFMVGSYEQTTKKPFSHKGNRFFSRLHSRFPRIPILHFAFRAPHDNPTFTYFSSFFLYVLSFRGP